MDKLWQEFYCNDCDGYIQVKINMALNQSIRVVCPNCKHAHPRHIMNGEIYEAYANRTWVEEEICPPKSAYHKQPIVQQRHARGGKPIDPKSFNLWFERFGAKL